MTVPKIFPVYKQTGHEKVSLFKDFQHYIFGMYYFVAFKDFLWSEKLVCVLMNCFCGMVGLQTADSRISARIGHHLDFPKRRGRNRSRIAETAIRSGTTTPRRHKCEFLNSSSLK